MGESSNSADSKIYGSLVLGCDSDEGDGFDSSRSTVSAGHKHECESCDRGCGQAESDDGEEDTCSESRPTLTTAETGLRPESGTGSGKSPASLSRAAVGQVDGDASRNHGTDSRRESTETGTRKPLRLLDLPVDVLKIIINEVKGFLIPLFLVFLFIKRLL